MRQTEWNTKHKWQQPRRQATVNNSFIATDNAMAATVTRLH